MSHARARTGYVYGVDVVRFVAATIVAVFHLTWLHPSTADMARFGWIGVQIFFVISGFVIAKSARGATPAKFVMSRALRLYPAAWICAAISFAVIVGRGIPGSFIGPLMRFGTSVVLYPTGPYLASAYWTLPIEISFYLLVLILLVFNRFDRLGQLADVLCVASSVYIVAYMLQSNGLLDGPSLEFAYGWKNITLLRHGMYFAFGIYLWLWSERQLDGRSRIFWTVSTISAAIEILSRSSELAVLSPGTPLGPFDYALPILLWLGACLALTAAIKWQRTIAALPRGLLSVVQTMGLATYPLYLIHEDVGGLARDRFLALGLPYGASACLAVLVTTVAAVVIARSLEPLLRDALRHRLQALGNAIRSHRLGRVHGSYVLDERDGIASVPDATALSPGKIGQ